MKTRTVTEYRCEICNTRYTTEKEALACEERSVLQDKGVQAGDTVRITRGEGQGLATVTNRLIFDREWGHYMWERYWHTVGLMATCNEGFGSRQLTFDDYEVVA